MSYKEEFNEWYTNFKDDNGRDPTLEECKEFRNNWCEELFEFADNMRGNI